MTGTERSHVPHKEEAIRFTLVYEGELHARQRGVGRDKAALRRHFHPQLRDQIEPFLVEDLAEHLTSRVSEHEFVCLAVDDLGFRAELDVLLMTGGKGVRAGDLDNRLKMLIDGLTRPANADQMQDFFKPDEGGPTYCLLEDDSLVTRLGVERRRWLGRPETSPDVLAVVNVTMTKSAVLLLRAASWHLTAPNHLRLPADPPRCQGTLS